MSNIMKDAMNKAGVKKGKGSKYSQVPKPAATQLKRGHVKWFDLRKGFGFIKADDGEEYFAHFSKITLGRTYTGFEPDDEVTFRVDVDPNTNRRQAVGITLNDTTETE